MTAESALGPTSPQSPRTSDSDSSSLDEVAPEGTEEDLGDADESPAAALAAFKQPFFSVQPPFCWFSTRSCEQYISSKATLKSAFFVEQY